MSASDVTGPLRDALCALALPPSEQIRVTAPGDVAAELYFDFRVAHSAYIEQPPGPLSPAQRQALEDVDRALEAVPDADFDDAALGRPSWDAARAAALAALATLGWPLEPPPPYSEVQPGVWRRPAGTQEPGATGQEPEERQAGQ